MDHDFSMKRIRQRHGEQNEELAKIMEDELKLIEPVSGDEENTSSVEISAEMTKEDVVNCVLQAIDSSR